MHIHPLLTSSLRCKEAAGRLSLLLLLLIAALLLTGAGFVDAYGSHFTFSGGVVLGPGWGWGVWGPWWWGAQGYPYYYPGPPVVEQPLPRYEEQAPEPEAEEETFWYYCPDARAYYPYVNRCPGGWMKVVPPPPPPDWEE